LDTCIDRAARFRAWPAADSLRVVGKDGALIDISPRSANNTYPFSAAPRRPAPIAAATVKIDGHPVFTKRQQSRNDTVMSIHCALNHPSTAKMKVLLATHPAYGLAASDVDSAFEESGPCPICLTKAPRFIGGDSHSPPPPLVGHTISKVGDLLTEREASGGGGLGLCGGRSGLRVGGRDRDDKLSRTCWKMFFSAADCIFSQTPSHKIIFFVKTHHTK
jgi:hypothetical protein